MLKKFLFTSLGVGVMAAVAASGTYKVQLYQNSVVDGKDLKPGNYKIQVENNTAVLKNGKQAVQVPARVETAPSKYASTEMEYLNNTTLQEIRIGGTHTKIVFTNPTSPATGVE
jgi:hypothetical protein